MTGFSVRGGLALDDNVRTLQNLTFAAAIAKRPVSAELTHLAIDIFIILLYQCFR